MELNRVGLSLFAWAMPSGLSQEKVGEGAECVLGRILPRGNQDQRPRYQCSGPFEESYRTVSKGMKEILDKWRIRPHA